jgi:arylsulfatase A-like enzyme
MRRFEHLTGMDSRPNLLFVTVDCLREDFLAGEHADTPFLDSLRADGLACTDLHSTTTTTTPSVASLLTGSYSERNGVNSLRDAELNPGVPTLAGELREAGYDTAAFVTGPLVADAGIDRGFDRFDHRAEDAELVGDWFDTAVGQVDDLGEPFFAYVHLWEIHKDISVPPAFDDPAYGSSPYARTLSALDRALERFVDAAPENTLVAVHGDHGESISWRHNRVRYACKRLRDKVRYEFDVDTRPAERLLNRVMAPFGPDYPDHFIEDGHGAAVYDFMTNVPFVLHGPGVEVSTVRTQCRQIDIAPTLLDQLDLLDAAVDGDSLFPLDALDDRPAYVRACGSTLRGEANWQRGMRTPEHKLVEYFNRPDWPLELYDLDGDPQELRDVAADHEDTADRLRRAFPDAELQDVRRLDNEDQLRDLGYL